MYFSFPFFDRHEIDNVGPVARFGDTAANAGILALLASNSYLKDLPSPIKTIFVSLWYFPTPLVPS
jgi:hypothetical protein